MIYFNVFVSMSVFVCFLFLSGCEQIGYFDLFLFFFLSLTFHFLGSTLVSCLNLLTVIFFSINIDRKTIRSKILFDRKENNRLLEVSCVSVCVCFFFFFGSFAITWSFQSNS